MPASPLASLPPLASLAPPPAAEQQTLAPRSSGVHLDEIPTAPPERCLQQLASFARGAMRVAEPPALAYASMRLRRGKRLQSMRRRARQGVGLDSNCVIKRTESTCNKRCVLSAEALSTHLVHIEPAIEHGRIQLSHSARSRQLGHRMIVISRRCRADAF